MPTTRLWKRPLLVQASMIYLMLGVMLAAWGVIWIYDEIGRDVPHRGVYLVCAGLLATGLSLVGVGLRMGRSGLDTSATDESDHVSGPIRR